MILSFSTQLNGKPTYFVEKIWGGLLRYVIPIDLAYVEYLERHEEKFGKHWDFLPEDHERMTNLKIHTIREDKKERWKPGTKIDFFINCRQKDMFRFAPVLPVVSVQKVEILYKPETVFFARTYPADVYVDKRRLEIREFAKFVHNDGFDTIEDFFSYFNKDFHGKIIHWTDLRY